MQSVRFRIRVEETDARFDYGACVCVYKKYTIFTRSGEGNKSFAEKDIFLFVTRDARKIGENEKKKKEI